MFKTQKLLTIFKQADNLIESLRQIGSKQDKQLESQFAGFISVKAVSAYEQAVKIIILEFANKQNKHFGSYLEKTILKKTNARVSISIIEEDYFKKLHNDVYHKSFLSALDKFDSMCIKKQKSPASAAYKNLIECRNKFTHEGSPTLTLKEAYDSYKKGKHIIRFLAKTFEKER